MIKENFIRNFNSLEDNEKVWLKLHVTAKQAAMLQKEAKKLGLTMSGYAALKLQQIIEKEESEDC